MPSADRAHLRLLDLEDLESESVPLFVIKTGEIALGFDFVFCNEYFRKLRLRNSILSQDKAALLFRSWAQALGDYKTEYEFDGRVWSAELAGKRGGWKIVRAVRSETTDGDQQMLDEEASGEDLSIGRTPIFRRSRTDLMRELKSDSPVSLKNIPYTNLHARWESVQTMMEMSDVGVFEYNTEGKLLHANEAWYRLTSHPRDTEHSEYSFMDLVYPEDQPLVMSMWNKLALGKPVTFEMRWKPRPGSNDIAQWVLSACVPVFDDDKTLIGIAGNTIDINAQKKSQAAAQAQVEALEQARVAEMKFARFAQVSPVAIYIYVPESGMNFVNDQFFELTGHAHAPVNQFEWFDLISDEDIENVKNNWESMLKGGKADAVQFRLKKTWVNQDGIRSNIWVQSSSYPELDESGRVINSVIASLQQLSGRRLAATDQDADVAKAQAEVQSCIESLLIIVSCSMHQKRVIDDVLTLSKLDSNLILITPMRVQPAVVVSDAVRMFDVECNQADIKLVFQVDETFDGMEWTMLDPSRLLQVLINLLTNAIKFTKDRPRKVITVTIGGSWSRPPKCWQDVTFTDDEKPKLDITDKSEWGDGRRAYLWLKVQDSGCGMTVDEQKKLFARFSQTTPRTHVKYGGSGLGLFISKSLTKLQGGAIGVNSVKEEGSIFAFYISTRLAYPPADQVDGRAVQARPVPHRTMTGEQAMQAVRLNVLIVEDNLVNQKVLRKQLEKFSWNISVAGNGQEALDWLKDSVYWQSEKETKEEEGSKHQLDIILMDIEMPIMDGLTCARLIRDYEHQGLLATPHQQYSQNRRHSTATRSPVQSNQSQSPSSHKQHSSTVSLERSKKQSLRLPILAVSANARMEQVEQALASGMDDAISKPFRIPELWPKIRGLVKRVADVDTRAKE
ncbi:putative histidine kinase HHK8p [Stemphylium lycopersici]|nr:histidine kinase hhk8p [Stemphylium lycopersici]RAR01856.1 putative histidine kinase HHK8p [Stemphylium lycopersici]